MPPRSRAAPAPDAADPDSSFSEDFLIFVVARAYFQLSLGFKRDLERQGLTEWQWFVLSILGMPDNCTVAELDRILWRTGTRVTYELVAGLVVAGLAQLHGSNDPSACVTLTEVGRRRRHRAGRGRQGHRVACRAQSRFRRGAAPQASAAQHHQ
jgi:hypothetical protein